MPLGASMEALQVINMINGFTRRLGEQVDIGLIREKTNQLDG